MQSRPAITITDVPSVEVLGTEKIGTYALIPDLLNKVLTYMLAHKVPVAGPPIFVCHEFSPESVHEANAKGTARVEVAWPVAGSVSGSGDIRSYSLPGGRMVHAVHKGPYETCEQTYMQVFAWIQRHSFTISGPIREVYPNDPREVPPEKIVTEIYIPVA